MTEFGPVQIMVVGFEEGKFEGKVLDELKRLRDLDIVRLIDLLFVQKKEDGELVTIQMSDLPQDESEELGAIIGALIGFGAEGTEGAEVGAEAGAAAMQDGGSVLGEDEMWDVADAIEPGASAAIALLEHRWAIPLRDAIAEAGGVTVTDEWVHPADLVAIGAVARESSG